MLAPIKSAFERLLQAIVIVLMVGLAVVVLLGITYRTAGAALVWYDEIAAILLAWLTYFGAALAALNRAHIGVPGVLKMLQPNLRAPLFVLAEILVFAFFALTAWIGYEVLEILAGTTLVSLPEVSEQVPQSVIMIGAILFIIAEALSLPEAWRQTMADAPPRLATPDQRAEMASTE